QAQQFVKSQQQPQYTQQYTYGYQNPYGDLPYQQPFPYHTQYQYQPQIHYQAYQPHSYQYYQYPPQYPAYHYPQPYGDQYQQSQQLQAQQSQTQAQLPNTQDQTQRDILSLPQPIKQEPYSNNQVPSPHPEANSPTVLDGAQNIINQELQNSNNNNNNNNNSENDAIILIKTPSPIVDISPPLSAPIGLKRKSFVPKSSKKNIQIYKTYSKDLLGPIQQIELIKGFNEELQQQQNNEEEIYNSSFCFLNCSTKRFFTVNSQGVYSEACELKIDSFDISAIEGLKLALLRDHSILLLGRGSKTLVSFQLPGFVSPRYLKTAQDNTRAIETIHSCSSKSLLYTSFRDGTLTLEKFSNQDSNFGLGFVSKVKENEIITSLTSTKTNIICFSPRYISVRTLETLQKLTEYVSEKPFKMVRSCIDKYLIVDDQNIMTVYNGLNCTQIFTRVLNEDINEISFLGSDNIVLCQKGLFKIFSCDQTFIEQTSHQLEENEYVTAISSPDNTTLLIATNIQSKCYHCKYK
ncbi:hypothetical protein DDB_G0286999, partial [Dictyostelium discoideum AX4]